MTGRTYRCRQMIRHFAWRELRQRALGPELRIWRIKRG
jgi:hypothetical protein